MFTDDFEPLNDDYDYKMKIRRNSAIHIRVFRKEAIEILKCKAKWISLAEQAIFVQLFRIY